MNDEPKKSVFLFALNSLDLPIDHNYHNKPFQYPNPPHTFQNKSGKPYQLGNPHYSPYNTCTCTLTILLSGYWRELRQTPGQMSFFCMIYMMNRIYNTIPLKYIFKKNGSCNYLQAILSKPVLNNTYGMHYHTNHKTTFSPHLQSPCIPRKVYTQDMSNRRFA